MTVPSEAKSDPAPDAELDLVRRLVDGDPAAWEEFVLRYQNLVWTSVRGAAQRYRLPLSTADLEDTVADVFAALLERDCAPLRRFQGRCSLATWLIVIARRRWLRRFRKSVPRTAPLFDDSVAASETAGGADPLENLIRREHQQQVRNALDHLSSADRHVLELYYQRKLSYADIGCELGISANSVGPRIHRAQKRLRRLLERGTGATPETHDAPADVSIVAATDGNRAELEHD